MLQIVVSTFILLFCCANHSEASVRLDANQARQSLGYEIYFLKEAEGPLGIDVVRSKSMAGKFKRADGPVPNFGITTDAYWFRIAIDFDALGHSEGLSRRVVTINYPFLDHIEFYSPDKAGKLTRYLAGDAIPFDLRPINHHEFAFDVYLASKQINELFIRIKTSTSLQVPIDIWTPSAFRDQTNSEKFGYGMFYGALLVMLFYNLFLYFSLRDKHFLNYVFYIATVALASASIDGLTYQYFWPNWPLLANVSIPALINLCVIAAIHFGITYLNSKSFAPRCYLLSRVIIVVTLLAFVPLMMGNYSVAILASTLLIVTMSTFLFSVGAYGIYKQQRRAYFFFVAWLFLFIGISVRSLATLDLLPTNFITVHAGQFGIALELILLSFGLGDRMNEDRAEKYKAIKASLTASQQTLKANEEKRLAAELLISQSLFDQLTGHPNRLSAQEELKQCLSQANAIDTKVSLACIHLGNFQDINNTLGHDAGDQFLKQFVAHLEDHVTAIDYVLAFKQRNGINQHLCVLEGVYLGIIFVHPKKETISAQVASIIQVFDKPINYNGMALTLQGKIGLAAWPDHGGDAETLMRKAKIAVRSAKWTRKAVQTYEESIDLYSAKRLSLMAELKNAIAEEQLELYFQPKIDLTTMKMVSMEALVRWNHPSRGILGPDVFIALAESTGMIKPLTRWVINNAAMVRQDLYTRGFDISIAINISARNLLEEDFVEQVQSTMSTWSLDPKQLVLEVVESAMIEDMELTIDTLRKLSDLGARISIDDFGTGYSSLEYLKKLPVDELKIDRSFISNMSQDGDDKLIAKTTLTIAHQLGLQVVAEGIENEATMQLLVEMGCDIGQGYYFSPPLSSEDIFEFTANSRWSAPRRINVLPSKESPNSNL